MAAKDYPLVPVTEILDALSVDNKVNKFDFYGDAILGPTEGIMERKFREVIDRDYDWTVDTEFNYPVHFFTWKPGKDAYGHTIDKSYTGTKMMGNGHHRLAFQAYVQGCLFIHVSENQRDCGNW